MPYSIGDQVAPFRFPRAGGGEYVLEPGQQAATLVVFTCNHCPYALAWHDRIQDVARDYAERRVATVQINANDSDKYPADSFEQMERRVVAGEFASPYVRDIDQLTSKEWGAKTTPDVFLLDGEGRVVYRGAPDSDHEDESQAGSYLREALDDLLAGQPLRRPATKSMGCGIKWTVNDQPNPHE